MAPSITISEVLPFRATTYIPIFRLTRQTNEMFPRRELELSLIPAHLFHIILSRTVHSLIRHSPGIKPFHVAEIFIRSLHSPTDGHEVDVQTSGDGVEASIDGILDLLNLVAEDPVSEEAEVEDCEIQSRVVVMDVSDTSHSHEGDVVQEPANDWVDGRIVDLIDILLLELGVTALPSDKIPDNKEAD